MQKQRNTGNFLFMIFWWIVQHVNVRWASTLLYWGLRDGSFASDKAGDPILAVDIFGRHFDSPVGLSDGVDKRGNVLDILMQMGYGFGTFGPYTLEKEMPAQEKYFFKNDRALIIQCNGYRNPGLIKMMPWFVKRRYLPHFVGIDVAVPTENEESNIKQGRHFSYEEEFTLMAQKLAPYCDYITLDFSHPNSELCVLMVDASTILPIVRSVKEMVQHAAPIRPPKVFVKIPLDINMMEVPLVAQTLLSSGADGVVVAGPISLAKNTRIKIKDAKENQMAGMLNGGPAHEYVKELIRRLYTHLQDKLPIISSGGLFDAQDAFDYISAGASLVMVDTCSLIYEGPGILHRLHQDLAKMLRAKKFNSLSEAVGSAVREEMAQAAASAAARNPEQPTTGDIPTQI